MKVLFQEGGAWYTGPTMTWQTHAMVGANAAWIPVVLGVADERLLLVAGAGAFAALLPDIDAPYAKIHTIGKRSFSSFRNVFRHRHFFHSFLAVGLVYLIVWAFFHDTIPVLALVCAAGYLSHLLIDGFNKTGVRLFFPFRIMVSFLPKSLRTRVGGPVDQLLFFVGLVSVLYLMVTHIDLFSIEASFV